MIDHLIDALIITLGTQYKYQNISNIGYGGSAIVLSAFIDNKRVALKCVYLEQKQEEFYAEVKFLNKLKHPNIIEMNCSFIVENFGILQLEWKPKDLMSVLEEQITVSELQAQMWFSQICTAVSYCHSQGIAHLDLKPDNILLDQSSFIITLTDFGSSTVFQPSGSSSANIKGGTYFYMPPEKINNLVVFPDKYDVWSLGILLHTLLTGRWPYLGGTEEQINQRVANGDVFLFVGQFSNDLTDLLHRIFTPNPDHRISIDEILCHPWMATGNKVRPNVWKKKAQVRNLLMSNYALNKQFIHSKLAVDLEVSQLSNSIESSDLTLDFGASATWKECLDSLRVKRSPREMDLTRSVSSTILSKGVAKLKRMLEPVEIK